MNISDLMFDKLPSLVLAHMCKQYNKKGYDSLDDYEKRNVNHFFDALIKSIDYDNVDTNMLTTLSSLEDDEKYAYIYDTVMHDVIDYLLSQYCDNVSIMAADEAKGVGSVMFNTFIKPDIEKRLNFKVLEWTDNVK